MSRPRLIVRITSFRASRGTPTATGPAFFAFASPDDALPLGPVVCRSEADAAAAFGDEQIVTWTGDALAEGAPQVTLVRADVADATTATEADWTAALNRLSDSLGPGQVAIPGVATAAAATALSKHAETTGRTVLIDGDETPTVAELLAQATAGQRAGVVSNGLVAPWVSAPAGGGVNRSIPGSVIAAGLAARGDAVVGHANHAPAFDQGRGAGTSRRGDKRGTGVTAVFTDAQWDQLEEAGVSLIVPTPDGPQLQGWRSLSDDPVFHQLNAGRLVMQLRAGVADRLRRFQGRQIDGRGHLYSEVEGALRGYLLPLYEAAALFGATADDAFDVQVADVNTTDDAAAGRVRSAIRASISQHTTDIELDVLTYLPGENA